MKKSIKIISIVSLIIICLTTISYGFGVSDLTGTQTNTSEIVVMGTNLVSILSSIGIVLSVIVLAIIGVKYMLGSVEEKAEYKKTFLPYLIGAIFVFSASVVAGIVFRIVQF